MKIIPDVNLLLYATASSFPEHAAARAWWEDALNGQTQVGLTPPVVFAFLRLSTSRKLFAVPMKTDRACEFVEEWLSRSNVEFLVPGERYLELAFRLLRESGATGSLTTDVQIAAHALESSDTVFSNDVDFRRFPGVKVINPLQRSR